MFQYSIETGYVDADGNEYVDDYVLTDGDRAYVVGEYVLTRLDDLEKHFRNDAGDDAVYVFKRLLGEKILDDDPDGYIQDSVVIAYESTEYPDAEHIDYAEQLGDIDSILAQIA